MNNQRKPGARCAIAVAVSTLFAMPAFAQQVDNTEPAVTTPANATDEPAPQKGAKGQLTNGIQTVVVTAQNAKKILTKLR